MLGERAEAKSHAATRTRVSFRLADLAKFSYHLYPSPAKQSEIGINVLSTGHTVIPYYRRARYLTTARTDSLSERGGGEL